MKPAAPSASWRTALTVWGAVGCFMVVLGMAASMLDWSVRKRAFNESEAQIGRFVAGAEAALNRALLGFDVLLASTGELDLAALERPGEAGEAELNPLLRRTARLNLMARYIALLDGQGRILASSSPGGSQFTDQLPPDFVRSVMQMPVAMLVVSAPAISFASSEHVLYVARRIQVRGSQPMLAVAQVSIGMLASVLMQGVDIQGLEVTLEHGDGQLLLGMPGVAAANSTALRKPALESVDEGAHWDLPARLTQVPALVFIRAALYQDLWITASLPRDAVLKGVRIQRQGIVVVALLLAAMVAATGGLVHAYLARMHAARQVIASSKALLDQALGSMVSGFLMLDAEHRVVQWNRRYEEICTWLKPVLAPGVPFRVLLEHTARVLLPRASEAELHDWVQRRLRQQGDPADAHEQTLPSGLVFQITERSIPGGGLVITCHDVTQLRRASEEAETLAFYDPLTGLPNRRLLLDRLAQAVAQVKRAGHRGALLFLDLDHFKVINDTRGHEVGDQLLQQVAGRLKEAVRTSDTVARLGGDEFVVLLAALSADSGEAMVQVRRVGEKILQALHQPYFLGGQSYRGACSIGATLFGSGEEAAAELLRQADIAMYQAKSARGNALCFFDPQMQAEINQRALWETELQTALAEEQFTLHYQPQVTAANRVVGAEALLRWQHPQRGLITPGEFIAVAEDCGLIVPIGAWVLRTACRQLAAWQDEPGCAALQLSINVSARQFRQSDFADSVIHEIRQAGAPAHLLELELTESLVLDDVDDSIAKMYQLRAKGVRFSVDDFGTGYSSLAYLTRLPLHQLKIDQSFVRNIGVRAGDDVIVQTIIGMARTLELEVIAEGVETTAQRDFLARHGCDLYQGYLFGRPVALAQFQAMAAALSAA